MALAQPHRGASLIPLLCRLRSADVLAFHLENCDKGNTPKVCKEEKQTPFFLPLKRHLTALLAPPKRASPNPVCQNHADSTRSCLTPFQLIPDLVGEVQIKKIKQGLLCVDRFSN